MAIPVYIDNGGLDSAVSTTVDVSFMGTINADDMLICQVIAGIDTDSWSNVTGWTKMGEVKYTGTSEQTFAAFWRRATGSESGTETFTYGSTSDTLSGIISRYTGVITSGDPIEDPDFNSGRTITEDANFHFNSLTTLGIDRLGIIALGVGNDQAAVVPSSWTERFNLGSIVGTDSQMAAFTLDIATAQTIAAGTGVLARNNSYGNVIFALIPASDDDNLTSLDLETGNTVISSPVIGQEHDLTGQDLSSGNVTIQNSTIAQIHALISQNILSGNTEISQPSLSESHFLTSQDIETGNVVIQNSTIEQIHELISQDLESQNPVISNPVLSETADNLTAQDIATQAVIITSAILGQIHVLTSQNIVTGNVIISNATIDERAFAPIIRRRVCRAQPEITYTPIIRRNDCS